MAGLFLKICNHWQRMIVYVMGFLVVVIVFSQFWALPSSKHIVSTLRPGKEGSFLRVIRKISPSWNLVMDGTSIVVEGVGNNASKMEDKGRDSELTFHVASSEDLFSMKKIRFLENGVDQLTALPNSAIRDGIKYSHNMEFPSNFTARSGQNSVDSTESPSIEGTISGSRSSSKEQKVEQFMKLEAVNKNDSSMIESYVQKKRGATITLSEMKTMLLHGPTFSTSVRRRGSSTRDRQLLSASLQIKNAPVLRSISDLHAPLFRNVSVFKRSYDLMERVLKIYVYKEGEKPIFHNPTLKGLYSAEGWFMKLLESSKHFTVRAPRKAHLYYLPFSSETLRTTLYDEKSRSIKNLEQYLANYLDLIKKRYHFWNRTGGADHFFVACHDWGPRITDQYMSSCIRGLCNANVARGFSIGKDVSVPVTYIRSGNDPTRDIGGKPVSERNLLAFFAGHLHGYLRPLLLQYWENKESDMKIMGPMQQDVQGHALYREYMKSSKYCICARGYGVHTPRVVESIFYGCVPVILSDNYVPPFFEVLDWEAFSVFILEKEIPNLRNILLSIPEEWYLDMQQNIKKVQRHFIWHKPPEKYDLFHLLLHSVWYNRVSQMRPA